MFHVSCSCLKFVFARSSRLITSPTPRCGLALQGPLAAWIEKETCDCIVQHLCMGFELDLYQPHELPLMAWYLEYLYSTMIAASKAISIGKPPPEAVMAAAAASSGKGLGAGLGKKPKAKPSPADAAAAAAANAALATEHLLMDCNRVLCQGLLRMAIWLRLNGLVKEIEVPFNDEGQRFDQRFACLHALIRPVSNCSGLRWQGKRVCCCNDAAK